MLGVWSDANGWFLNLGRPGRPPRAIAVGRSVAGDGTRVSALGEPGLVEAAGPATVQPGTSRRFVPHEHSGAEPLLQKESHHFPRCIGALRVRISTIRTAAGPGVACSVHHPQFGLWDAVLQLGGARERPAPSSDLNARSVGPARFGACCDRRSPLGAARLGVNGFTIQWVYHAVAVAMKDDRGDCVFALCTSACGDPIGGSRTTVHRAQGWT